MTCLTAIPVQAGSAAAWATQLGRRVWLGRPVVQAAARIRFTGLSTDLRRLCQLSIDWRCLFGLMQQEFAAAALAKASRDQRICFTFGAAHNTSSALRGKDSAKPIH